MNAAVKPDVTGEPEELAIELATSLLHAALRAQTMQERKEAARMHGLVSHPEAKTFSMMLTDRIFRSEDYGRTAEAFRAVSERYPPGAGFSKLDRWLLRMAAKASLFVPTVVVSAIRSRMRRTAASSWCSP